MCVRAFDLRARTFLVLAFRIEHCRKSLLMRRGKARRFPKATLANFERQGFIARCNPQ